MGSVRRTVKNLLSLSIAQLISQASLFLALVYLARTLGAADLGKIAFAQAVILYFTLTTNLGLNILGVREVARDRNNIDKYVSNILGLRLVLAVVSFSLLLIFVWVINKTSEVKYLIIFFGFSLFFSALLLEWLFQGVEKMGSISISRILNRFFYVALIFLLVRNSRQILIIPWLYTGGTLIASGFLLFAYVRRFGKLRLSFDFLFWKDMLRRALPMGAAFVMIQIYYNFDTVMLGFMKNDEVVGWYNAAYKIVLFIWAFIPIFMNVIFPLMSKYYKQSRRKLERLISSATRVMITVAFPLGLGGTFLAGPIITFFYGTEFSNGIIAFQILIWTVVVIAIRCTYEQSFLACDRGKRYLWGVMIGAGTNIVLNLFFIPYFGLKGAAVATVISEIVFSLYMFYYFDLVSRTKILGFLLKPFLAASFMGLVLYYLKDVNLLLSILIGVITYSAAIFLLKGVTWAEVKELKAQIVQKG